MVAEHITNLPVTGKDSGRRGRTALLVLHSGETPLEPGYAASVTRNWLNQPNVEASTHVFAGPETLVRSVNTYMAAWHASIANGISIGYEQTGYAAFSAAQWLTPNGRNQLDRLAREMAADAKLFGIPLRWLSTPEVHRALNGDTSVKGFCTHAQIDPSNRTDPGSQYPYQLLIDTVKAYSGVAPTPAPKPTPTPAPAPTKRKTYPMSQAHWTVEKGDSLSKIAQFFYSKSDAATVKRIADHMGMKVTDVIRPGETIWVPGPLGWIVEGPDEIRTIAARYGYDPGYLAQLNGLGWNPDATIYVGNTFWIQK